MIDWNKNSAPLNGCRVIIKLANGVICSGTATESGGVELEQVDNIMLLAAYTSSEEIEWIYAHTESKEP